MTYTRHDLDFCPFSLIKNEENGEIRISAGNTIISEKIFNTEEEAIEYINEKPWEVLINCIGVIVETCIKVQQEEKKEMLKKHLELIKEQQNND